MKNILVIFVLLVLFVSCSPVEKTTVTQEQTEQNIYPQSNIRNIRFKSLGEGNSVYIYFKPFTWKSLTILPGYQFSAGSIGDMRRDYLVFNNATFPFYLYMDYYIEVPEGSRTARKRCRAEIRIKEKGSWKVEVYH